MIYSFVAFPQKKINSDSTCTKLNGKYLLSYWHDTKTIVAEPFHWRWKQWGTTAGIAAIWAVTYSFDDEIYKAVQENRSKGSNNISQYVIEPWGSGMYSIPLFAGMYVFSKPGSRHKQVALTGVKAFLITGGATAIAKHMFHRHRPGDNTPPDPRQWDGPLPLTTNFTSFPSGHTSVSFAMATVLALGYKDKPWVGITGYSVAALVGISRINDGKHWASDVVAGAALGSFIGITLSRINIKNLNLEADFSTPTPGLKLSLHLN
ncbi:MAG: phosphatase PAP2 family protein [Bacteroidales bacterium]|nr:phosphatase PAP2 family protein [Bacteroidales bacterium]